MIMKSGLLLIQRPFGPKQRFKLKAFARGVFAKRALNRLKLVAGNIVVNFVKVKEYSINWCCFGFTNNLGQVPSNHSDSFTWPKNKVSKNVIKEMNSYSESLFMKQRQAKVRDNKSGFQNLAILIVFIQFYFGYLILSMVISFGLPIHQSLLTIFDNFTMPTFLQVLEKPTSFHFNESQIFKKMMKVFGSFSFLKGKQFHQFFMAFEESEKITVCQHRSLKCGSQLDFREYFNYKRNYYNHSQNNIQEMNTEQKHQSQKTKIKIDEPKRIQLLHNFLNQNQKELIKDISFDKVKVTIVPSEQQYGDVLGQMIRNGQLVGFPTETVYGLGADATNENALLQIYRVKRRPLSDPIIVHVLNFEAAKSLVEPQSEKQLELFQKLTKQFWPGPLTVILKANLSILPNVVTASTGFVGLRSPKSKFARRLIQKSKRPIGAPSANLFSHVSPTSAVHVLNDFYDQEIAIVDGEKCQFGVESTVVKIVDGKLQILREGSLSTKKLSEFVRKQFEEKISVEVKKRVQKQDQEENMEAPGQLLKHYAPYLPCFSSSLENIEGKEQSQTNQSFKLNEVAFITFSDKFNHIKEKVKFYLSADNLSELDIVNQQNDEDQKFCTIQEKKKMRSLYFLLRKAQNLEVKAIVIGWEQPKQGTLWDKIFRSTQGKIAKLF